MAEEYEERLQQLLEILSRNADEAALQEVINILTIEDINEIEGQTSILTEVWTKPEWTSGMERIVERLIRIGDPQDCIGQATPNGESLLTRTVEFNAYYLFMLLREFAWESAVNVGTQDLSDYFYLTGAEIIRDCIMYALVPIRELDYAFLARQDLNENVMLELAEHISFRPQEAQRMLTAALRYHNLNVARYLLLHGIRPTEPPATEEMRRLISTYDPNYEFRPTDYAVLDSNSRQQISTIETLAIGSIFQALPRELRDIIYTFTIKER